MTRCPARELDLRQGHLGLASGQIARDDVIRTSEEQPVYTSVIFIGELVFGVHACADPATRALRAAWLRQMERSPSLLFNPQTAAAFGVLAAAVKQSGRSPRPRYDDLWIAAQAIEHGHSLLTVNAKDFAGLPGLRLAELG
jgi:predicted nucleic acid-binding protein